MPPIHVTSGGAAAVVCAAAFMVHRPTGAWEQRLQRAGGGEVEGESDVKRWQRR